MKIRTVSDAKRRTMMIYVRLTPDERELLISKAKESGLTLSDWIRGKAIGAKPLLRKPTPEREILLRFLAAFGKAGSNLNQLQRSIARKQYSEDFELPLVYIKQLLSDMKDLTERLRNAFGNSN